MRAVVIDAVRARPEVRDVPVPTAPDGGVVVRVAATGLCRSDWHAWAGHDDIAFPHVPGHELAGKVVEVGTGVTRWQVGDRVTVPFVCGCGHCRWCRAGDAQVCPDQQQPGFTHWGSFAEHVALHAAAPGSLSRATDLRSGKPSTGGPELRGYGVGAQILAALGVHDMILLTNTRHAPVGLSAYGLTIVEERGIVAGSAN